MKGRYSGTMLRVVGSGLIFLLILMLTATAQAYRPLVMQTMPGGAYDHPVGGSGSASEDAAPDAWFNNKRVKIDVSALRDVQEGDEIDLDLDGRIVTAVTDRIEKTEDGSKITWSGKIRASSDIPTSIFVITVLDGFVSGAFETGDVTYEVVPGQERGEGILVNRTFSLPVEDADAVVPDGDSISGSLLTEALEARPDNPMTAADNTGQTTQYIDILAIYTTDLLQRYGGEAQLKTQIENLVNYANTVLKNSNINAAVRVVGYRSVAVADSTAMGRLIDDMYSGTGAFADILKWMDEVGADQATLFIPFQYPKTSYCGLGYQPVNTDTYTNTSQYYVDYRKKIFRTVVALGSTKYNGLTYYCDSPTFIHELGHNLGAGHDRANSNVTPIFPYAYGYCGPNYGTIMAYCWPRVPYFSENRTVDGKVIGNAQAENAKVLRFTTPYVASTRDRWRTHFDTVQKVYIAYYQRPADPGGLRYWAQRLDAAGGSLNEIIDAFANSDESRALYGNINQSNIGNVIDSIYRALFGRDTDQAGKEWYTREFNAGRITPGKIALAILNGARNDDAVAIQNKLQVANTFTQMVDGRPYAHPDFGIAPYKVNYSGENGLQRVRDMLRKVDSTSIPSDKEIEIFVQSL